MSFVKEITTNIKSPDGNSQHYILGKHTLLIGPNESGKSALAEAVQLALTGSAFGLLYRNKPIKAGKQLSVLKPEGADTVYSQAILDTGESAEWTLEEGKRPGRTGVEGYALPMNDLRSIMAGSDATIRSFFYDNMIKESERSEIQAHLSDRLWDAFNEFCLSGDTVSLTTLIGTLGKRKREEAAVGKAAQRMLERMNPETISDAQVSTLWLQLGEAQRLEALREMYRLHRTSYQAVDGEGESLMLAKIKASLSAFGPKEKIQGMVSPDAARGALEAALAARGAHGAAVDTKRLINNSEAAVESIGKLEKALGVVLQELLIELNVWSTFQARVNEFLPNKDIFKVIDNGALTMGLVRENGLHVALSGSTEARTLAAMSAAFIQSKRARGGEDYPALIVVDDRMWDTATLAKTMKELEKADCQVIMMTTQKPRGRAREAWTYLDMGKTNANV